MVIRYDYGKKEVNACLSVLVELMTILGEFRDDMVLVGGWIPYFLTEKNRREGLGKIKAKFKNINAPGPIWLINFEDINDEEEKERVKRDAYKRINVFLDTLRIEEFKEG